MEIVHVYQKKRREFGRQCNFSDRNATLIFDVDPDAELRQQYIYKDPVNVAVQNGKEFSEHEVNTERVEYTDKGMDHTEGGWPKDVDPAENEQTSRYRKKVEKDEHFQLSVSNLADMVEDVVKENNTIDIYQEYFPEKSSLATVSKPEARTLNMFRDPDTPNRSVTSITWSPDGARRFAASYSVIEFQKATSKTSTKSYIWNLDKPTEPEGFLSSSCPVVSIVFNPKDSHILLGGLYNGQLALWDTRKGPVPTETTPVETTHRDPVYAALFLNSKSGTEFFSCSTDGSVRWWDSRKIEEPTEKLDLDLDESGVLSGGVCMNYESTMPTRLMVGTEQGLVVNVNRKAKTVVEKLSTTYDAHHGPVYAVCRSPILPKYFLTVGDWTVKLWADDIKESYVLSSPYKPCRVYSCCWSSTRTGVYFVGRADGVLEIYDLTFKLNEPCLTLQVCSSGIRCISNSSDGQLLACGSHDGTITLVELNEPLYVLQKNEKATIGALLEKESTREKAIASRVRELTLQERARSAKASKASIHEEAPAEEDEEDPIQQAEDSFWSVVDPERFDAMKKEREAQQTAQKSEQEE